MAGEFAKTKQEVMWKLLCKFREKHGRDPFVWQEVFDFNDNDPDGDIWEMPDDTRAKMFQRDFQQTIRAAKYENAQGVAVRKVLSAKLRVPDENGVVKQQTFWQFAEDADKGFAVRSAFQRRGQSLADCVSASRDVDNWNDNVRKPGETPIEISFNFDEEVAQVKRGEIDLPDEDEDH